MMKTTTPAATAMKSNIPAAPADNESFAALFEESLSRARKCGSGEVITAEVIRVDDNIVVVNAGLKSESFIPIEEFQNDRGEIEVKPGDFVTVAIEVARRRLRRNAPVARQGQAPRGLARSRRSDGEGHRRAGHRSTARSRAA